MGAASPLWAAGGHLGDEMLDLGVWQRILAQFVFKHNVRILLKLLGCRLLLRRGSLSGAALGSSVFATGCLPSALRYCLLSVCGLRSAPRSLCLRHGRAPFIQKARARAPARKKQK